MHPASRVRTISIGGDDVSSVGLNEIWGADTGFCGEDGVAVMMGSSGEVKESVLILIRWRGLRGEREGVHSSRISRSAATTLLAGCGTSLLV